MKVIVVTGGIGSGKSTVCRIMNERFGIPVYEADSRVKSLYSTHPSLLNDIESELGENFRDESGRFVPVLLARRIFSDSKALMTVEGLIFPTMMEDFNEFVNDNPDAGSIIFESATILEKPQFDGFGDVTVLIDAPYEVRLQRALQRDGSQKDEVIRRMDNQTLMNRLSSGESDERVDFVVNNDSSLDDLYHKIDELMNNINVNQVNVHVK